VTATGKHEERPIGWLTNTLLAGVGLVVLADATRNWWIFPWR
jgi:hypothetical protein